MKRTRLQQEAQQLGFPASLFGYTPDVAAYWWEPGLPYVADPGATSALTCIAPESPEYIFAGDEMAPRFPLGTPVILAPAPSDHPLQIGRVYVRIPEQGEPEVGRLAWLHDTELELTQDNSPAVLRWPLGVGTVYAVTHYVDCPGPRAFPGPRTTAPAQPYLLQLHANQMGPRYPAGARYLVYLVPPSRWTQSRGVHAFELRSGRQLLARLIGPSEEEDELYFLLDATAQLGSVALADVAQLWKLGAADYLPEEPEADHLALVEQVLNESRGMLRVS